MLKNKLEDFLLKFEEYIKHRGELTNIQKIIWFYIFIRGELKNSVDKGYKFPWSKYVRVAKEIDDWAGGSLEQTYDLIWNLKREFERKNLEWTLHTVYSYIPKYEARVSTQADEIVEIDDMEFNIKKTKIYIAWLSGDITEEEYNRQNEELMKDVYSQ
jgi:hypothetical protein